MIGSTSYAALDLGWNTLDATIVLGQDMPSLPCGRSPTSNAPHPVPSIHASRGINHQRAR
jgi:hypothetical protein